jgi:hypothetical protein
MYRVKPWQQGITPKNQQHCPNVNGCNVPTDIQRLSLPKNHMASIPASTLGITFSVMLFVIAGMPAMHFTHSNALRPGQVFMLMWKNLLVTTVTIVPQQEKSLHLSAWFTRARLCPLCSEF